MTRHWLCTACEKQHDVEPLKCECGGREFAAVTATVAENGLGVSLAAELVDRSPKPRIHRPRR
jgi:hypothetical protein